MSVTIELTDKQLNAIAERAAAIALERLAQSNAVHSEWLRGADAIGSYIGASRSRVYGLAACTPPRIPVHKDGSALVARRSDLDLWLENGGGRRP